MKRINTINLITVMWMMLSTAAWSQQKLHVVTRTINKTIPYKTGYQLVLNGEKAEVKLDTWDKNEVKVTMKLIAKHPDIEQARRDVKVMNYIVERMGKKIFLRNYIVLKEKSDKPQSNLKAEYTVFLPKNCPVAVVNKFGKLEVINVETALTIESEFCQIYLNQINGRIDITSKFGDITGRNIDAAATINSHRSDIRLEEIKGTYDIDAKYGKITITANPEVVELNIKSDKSDIKLQESSVSHQYKLETTFGKILVPETMAFDFIKNTKEVQKAEFKPSNALKQIKISSTYSNITVE